MDHMTIGTLARKGGVSVETVRYYQRRDLLDTPERGDSGLSGGVRRYAENDLKRLRFIRQAQGAGFTLEEIGELLTLDAGHDHARARELAGGVSQHWIGRLQSFRRRVWRWRNWLMHVRTVTGHARS